jgi:hypothetical protein
MRQHMVRFCIGAIGILASCCAARASVVYTSGTYSQNFDSLPASGTAAWANDSTLPGWSLFVQPSPGSAPPSIAAGDGSSNAGTFNSFGTTGSSDRALGGTGSGGSYFGSPATNSVAGWWAVDISNGTGSTINSFTLSFDGEEWRNGGNTSPQTMALQYGFGATFGSVATWVSPGGNFDFTSPTVGSTAAALDGNAAANRQAGLGGTISNLSWANGTHLWVRWIENNDAGNDHGMGVDNFQFSAPTVPEPATLVLGCFGLAALTVVRRSVCRPRA